ncbi:MAG TPA: 3-phosphoshikimate 1-carboxyvinyltransferase [Verrucomicrobiae bacterium]|nr:3-phosphoshikimate 1-carboxyvinyltransferase [Verrucomicrobiae bacterium]
MKSLPDILEIEPLAKPPDCTITVPGSKSITNRALILAALADGKCVLRGALWADDTQVMVDSLQKLGFEVTVEPDPAEECNRTITVVGRGGEIPAKKADLYVGNAGTAARFLTALVCLGLGEYRIDGDARMRERPMRHLFDALRGLKVQMEAEHDRLPVLIHAHGLRGGRVDIAMTASSQFASAVTLISRRARLELSFHNWEKEKQGYVAMTEDVVRSFSADYLIEPDLSSASYFVASGWMTGGHVDVAGWPARPVQIDGEFRKFLPPPPSVSRLRDLGDSVLTLAVCALFGKQPLRVVDAERLRLQETDRIEAMMTELGRVGAKAEARSDRFTVWPAEPGQLHGADIETYNDHRMAMCFAVLGLKVPGIRIKNPGCVSKTFPNFFDKLEQLRQ